MPCLLPDVLDALSGGPVPDARMVEAPPFVGAPGRRMAAGKGVYGEDLPYHLDGAHFTVQWSEPTVDPDRAADILAELEDAWTVLVDEDAWPAPVSSDAWLLWVILDPDLGGSGYTTVYTTDDYPQGYPVSYLDPDYDFDDDPLFELSVAVHEFGHMLQYRQRGAQAGRSDAWYWEATSEWTAEHAAPDLDRYAESTYWYAQWPDARFDTNERWHPYGMLLLNAYLDERVFGFDGIRDAWIASSGSDATWDAILAEQAGVDFGTLVAGMAAEVGAGTLRESELYDVPLREATFDTPPVATDVEPPGLYGSYYVDVAEGDLRVEGDVAVAYVVDGEIRRTPPEEGPYTAVITALADDAALRWGAPAEAPPEEEEPEGCACDQARSPGMFPWWVGLLLVRRRRRRR